MNPMRDRPTSPPAHPVNYARLAPSVEQDWVEGFVLEQRLLGVPGHRIGDTLALIESHVTESGEPVREAFGDPKAYARQAAPSRRVEGDRDPWWLVGLGLGLVGMFLTGVGADEWLFGSGQIEVTAGLLVSGGLLLAAFAVLVLATDMVLRLAVERTWTFLGVCAVYAGAVVAINLVLGDGVGRWSAVPVTVVGAGLLVLSAVLQWRTASQGGLDDPIVGPIQQPEAEGARAAASSVPGSVPNPGSRAAGLLGWLTVFLFPILTVLMVALSWVLHLLA